MNAIYCRVSTDMQAETGYSIGDQIATCHAYASKLGLETASISEYVDEGYSGEYLERPALDRLRDDIRVNLIQNVIVYDPDRLSRNLTNQLLLADEIEKASVNLHFVTGSYDASPEGRLFFSIRGAISAFEKAKIRERTLRGKRAKALSGKIIQKTQPYGYDWDAENNTYLINGEEAAIVKRIYDLYLTRSISIKNIALLFRQQNIRNRNNKPITLSLIYRILTDEKYAGTKWSFKNYDKKISQYKRQKLTRTKDDWIPIPVSPIVSLEQFQAAKKLLSENKRKSPRNTKHEYLLRSFLKCGVCGYALSAHHKQHPSGKEYNWYKCSSGGTDKALISCGNPAISSVQLDQIVWNYLCNIAKNNKEIWLFTQHYESLANTAQITALKNYQNDLEKKQATILHWFKNSMLLSDMAEKELTDIKKELESTISAITKLSLANKKMINLTPNEILDNKSFSDRRAVIEKIGWKLYIDNRTKPMKIVFRI